jgi:hypothetical protein
VQVLEASEVRVRRNAKLRNRAIKTNDGVVGSSQEVRSGETRCGIDDSGQVARNTGTQNTRAVEHLQHVHMDYKAMGLICEMELMQEA